MADLSSAVHQQETLQPGRYMLRHIAPKQAESGMAGIINPAGGAFTVLAQQLYAEPLPISRLPDSPDFHEGKYTLRMLDAGDFELSFPNKDASDGRPWRERFSTEGHTEFVEISREGEVEFIGVIVKVTKDREKIVITGYDAFFLLKKAYEEGWTGVMAPRDVIERYTEPTVTLSQSSEFPGIALPSGWSVFTGSGSSVTVDNGVTLTTTSAFHFAGIYALKAIATSRWNVRANVSLPASGQPAIMELLVGAAGVEEPKVIIEWQTAQSAILRTEQLATLPAALPITNTVGGHTLNMVSDGRWVSAYIDGQLIGVTVDPTKGEREVEIRIRGTEAKPAGSAVVNAMFLKEQQPFVMRGAEKGDYVLPGTASTYPTGGLHGRYIVQGATTTSEKWWQTILAPDPRRSGFPEYIQGQIQNLSNNPIPGIPEKFWAARWFGAIYLPLSKGNVPITMGLGGTTAARVWIGKTQFGQQLIDSWGSLGAPRELTATVNAAALGSKDGWYPIIVEFAGGSEIAVESYFAFAFTPAGTYTDPGGTVLKGAESVRVPTTSLSPLGCVDARFQGSSFFDLVQETAKNFGYQLTLEPKQLESGEFPGQLVPKARIGKETDEIIEADDLDRKSGMNNYSQTLDATDSAGSVKAFGSGIADGKGSQISFEAVSLVDEAAALFDLQAWCAASDIAFPELLAARAEAELALRLGSWENVEGEPLARDRLADTFPLTGALNQFRWRIGDGVRLYLPDVGIADTEPRPIFQVTRTLAPEGRIGTSIGFRARPKDPLYAVRTALREATRSVRSYQKQYATRPSSVIEQSTPAGATTGVVVAALLPGENIVDAKVLILTNSASTSTGIQINGTERTAELGGPWTGPVVIDILPYAIPNGGARETYIDVRLKNLSGSAESALRFQMILTFLV
ncbi:MAG TPA: hypothetical protein VK721_06150 [Solirubrobacteraceae bacterium]|jgi:hypothetical protein|nr:hypothetical protein [Solirubrobacteraceae bacterium]